MGLLGEAYIAEVGYRGETYGSTFLKSLQTEKLPELDLLVRESVQNSSDAAIGIRDKNVWIDYSYSDFEHERLLDELGLVGEKLRPLMKGEQHFLEIRDTKTVGLTGPWDPADFKDPKNHGNYFKLVHDTGIEQEQQGSGGNWGFGKSVYYRVSSVGLVIFYSRIAGKKGSPSEERLIVTMVEDQNKGVLKSIVGNPTGRAWWGRPGTPKDKVWPIVDSDAIRSFLSIFHLEPFENGKTGTSVIIPFVDESQLLKDVVPHDGSGYSDEINRCTWKNSIPEYLTHALQKWYAPRLLNSRLEKLNDHGIFEYKWIRARVDGDLITSDKMDPLFALVQDLYNTALFSCLGKDYTPSHSDVRCKSIDIRKESLQNTTAGYVAYTSITNRELYPYRTPANPYFSTGNFKNSEDENEPIVMFAREPGMVIDYSIDNTWTAKVKAPKNNKGSDDDEFILAFFVPCVKNAFVDNGNDERKRLYGTLGGYLRKCEESDHASWEDKAKYRLISKIKSGVGKKIATDLNEQSTVAVPITANRMSGWLGRLLMPVQGMLDGKARSNKAKGSGAESRGGARPSFMMEEAFWRDGLLVVPFQLGMGSSAERELRLEVQTESGTVSPAFWTGAIKTGFPISIVEATAELEKKDGNKIRVYCDSSHRVQQEEPLSMRLIDREAENTALAVGCSVPGQLLSGEICLKTSDKTLECVIKAVDSTERKG